MRVCASFVINLKTQAALVYGQMKRTRLANIRQLIIMYIYVHVCVCIQVLLIIFIFYINIIFFDYDQLLTAWNLLTAIFFYFSKTYSFFNSHIFLCSSDIIICGRFCSGTPFSFWIVCIRT